MLLQNSASVGTISNTPFIGVDGLFVENTNDGLTLVGSFTSSRIKNFFVNSTVTDASFVAFTLDPTFAVANNGNFTFDGCFMTTLAGQVWMFDQGVNFSNIELLSFRNNILSGIGTISNFSFINPSIVTRDNVGIQSSKLVGFMSFAGNSLLTTITTQNTFEDITIDAPGFVLNSNSEQFSLTGVQPTQSLTYIGKNPVKIVVKCSMAFTGTSNNAGFAVRLLKNGVLIPSGEFESSVRNSSRFAYIEVTTFTVLNTNDSIRPQITCTTGTQDMRVKDCNMIIS